jgi:putative NADPH-quinone reductase
MAELLKPFERTARFCGMRWREPLVFHGAHEADAQRIAAHGQALRRLLEAAG